MKWIGLTGGIATGKTATKKLIEHLGFPVIDADELARLVVHPDHQGFQEVVANFGANIILPNGSLNRSALAEIIFKSLPQKQKLEAILHPLIQIEVKKLKTEYEQKGKKICFYDVPLLFEKKLQQQFASVILVWCDPQTQKDRLKKRDHLTDEEIENRLNAQMPLCEKLPLANYCIDNSTTLHNLEIQVRALVGKLI